MYVERYFFCFEFWVFVLTNFAGGTELSLPPGCTRLSRPPWFFCRLPQGFREKNEHDVIFEATTENIVETTNFDGVTNGAGVETTMVTIAPGDVYDMASDVETSTTDLTVTIEYDDNENISVETEAKTTLKPTTLSAEAEIIEELREPPPQRKNGPTVMEEIFIDTLTGGTHHTPPAQLAKALELKSAKQLERLCRRFLSAAIHRCRGEYTHPSYMSQCRGFFDDCGRFVPRADPVYESSRNYQRNIFYGYDFPFSP